jgi:hypothetical protein
MVHHMDVKTAFLNGDLKEEICMELPSGVNNQNKNMVCKFNKSLYGLIRISYGGSPGRSHYAGN